jgi:hypothetical protein
VRQPAAVVTREHWPAIQGSPLAVVPSAAVQSQSGSRGVYSFGTISALDTPRIEATFVVKNAGPIKLSVTRLEASCGCTSALLARETKPAGTETGHPATPQLTTRSGRTSRSESEPVALDPGESASLHVTLNLANLSPGAVSKLVSVYVAGRDMPAAVCALTGKLTPIVVFSPPVIQLGRLSPEESKTFLVTARLDRRLASSPASPRLVSNSPGIRIAPDTAPAAPDSAAPGPIERKYRISLAPDAPIGYFQARLFFTPEHADVSPATLALIHTSVLVVGELTGSVSAQPLYMAFGTVAHGTRVEHEVVLTSSETSFPSGARVTTTSPYLEATLQSPVGSTARLKIAILPTAPRGIVQGQVRVSLGARQLVIPVSGYINY